MNAVDKAINSKNELDHKTLKVLIADDDAPTRMLLRAAISQWGYEVVEASNGEEAWEILQQPDPPWLLIVDWLMPKLDGVALCARIKNELTHYPYTILLTQLTGTTNVIKGLEAGADEFLPKPFNMAELRSRLSVGARIVRYENELAAQNKQLKNYITRTAELENTILSLSNKLNTIKQSGVEMLDPNNKNNETIVKTLESDIKHLIELTKEFKDIKKQP
jgi:DNA-binding response OmpR family regulator